MQDNLGVFSNVLMKNSIPWACVKVLTTNIHLEYQDLRILEELVSIEDLTSVVLLLTYPETFVVALRSGERKLRFALYTLTIINHVI